MKKHPPHLKLGMLLVLVGALLLVCSYILSNYFCWPRICSQGHCFTIEIADTVEKRQQWLMYRKELPENRGMLFVFDRLDIHNFWMKNTLIPLDMIWLDSDFTIVDIQTAEPCVQEPCRDYIPKELAKYVLEINWGIAQTIWMTPWEKMDIVVY